MAEFTYVGNQVITANSNVLFTETPISPSRCILHREGSGIVTLRGLTNQCKARFRVSFYGNIGAVTDAELLTLAITLNGEQLDEGIMNSTPATVGDLNNVSASVFIDVPQGCCTSVSVKSINTQSINVSNANLIVERVA